MKVKTKILICIIILITILLIGVYAVVSKSDIQNIINSGNHTLNNSTNIGSNIVTNTPTINVNNTQNLLTNDYIINHINWESYPNLEVGYIVENEIREPNDFVDHKYIAVEIATEVQGTDNSTIINKQLADVALEVRQIYGPNCAIGIFGMDQGVLVWSVTMYVSDDNIY
jgi:hypothetical protein